MKHKKFKKPKAGEWVQPKLRNYLMACCDCGLVHRMDFMVVEGVRNGRKIKRVQFRVFRSPNYTKWLRDKLNK